MAWVLPALTARCGRRSQAPHEPLCKALRDALPGFCIVGPECFGFACVVDMFGTELAVGVDRIGVCLPEQHVLLAVERTVQALAANASAVKVSDRGHGDEKRAEGCYDISVHQCDCGIPDAATCLALNVPGQMPRFFWTPGCTSCAQEREWGFRFEATGPPTNYSRRMSGLDYAVSTCAHEDGASGFAVGQFRSAGGEGNVLLSVGLDACCASQSSQQQGDELATILVTARVAAAAAATTSTDETVAAEGATAAVAAAAAAAVRRRQLDEGPGTPDGCYDISVHRCDCGVPNEAVCNALNIPGQGQRFF